MFVDSILICTVFSLEDVFGIVIIIFIIVYEQLTHIQSLLERHYRDMQDIEFTVENAV